MTKENIPQIYNEIFETYPDIQLEEHVKKLIELDEFYPYNATFYCITNTATQSFEFVSKNFTACTGLSKDHILSEGMNYFWSLFHPNDIQLWLQCLKELMAFTMNELNSLSLFRR